MNITEAAIRAKDDGGLWLRPLSWRGHGRALMLRNGAFMSVPSIFGARPYSLTFADILSEWETVMPNVVVDEYIGNGGER